MKLQADKKRSDRQFSVGDKVLLKLQPYTQSLVASRPYPKLAYKFFWPYKVLERIGAVAYKWELPPHSEIHPVFHICLLKSFLLDYTPIYSDLPAVIDLQASNAVPKLILKHRLVRKGNAVVPHVFIKWSGLSPASATWEDYNVLKTRYPLAPTWGQADSSAGGVVTT